MRVTRTLRGAAIAALVCLTGGSASGTQQAPGGTPTMVSATAVISGRVIDASRGSPVRGAEVRARAADGRDNRLITTDEQGRYELRDLTPGEWRLTASKAGFVPMQYGQRHPREPGRAITLTNGARATAGLVLIRGAAIAGRVLDEYGDPVAGARVQALRLQALKGRQELTASGTGDESDDTGAFRLYGLMPGDYYVAATFAQDVGPRNLIGSSATYFPRARNINDAQPVTIAAGEDQAGITIVAAPVSIGVTVSGRVITASGSPATGGSVHLYRGSGPATTARAGLTAFIGPDGRFTARDVPPGAYVVHAEAGAGPARELGETPIQVAATVPSEVLVTTRGTMTLTVSMATADGSPLPAGARPELSIESAGATGSSFMNRVTMTGSTVRVPGLSGRVLLNVHELPAGWMVQRIDVGGRDVSDSVLDLAGLGAAAEARILLTNRSAAVSGRVTSRGEAAVGAVIIFPDDESRWGYPSRGARIARTDDEGRFEIAGLHGGNYRIAAVPYAETDAEFDVQFLAGLKPAALAVALRTGERKAVDLQLVVQK